MSRREDRKAFQCSNGTWNAQAPPPNSTIFVSVICLCDITLTKNLRGGLMFLDDDMSSSGRNEKHLKGAFGVGAEGPKQEEENRQETA